MTKQAALSVRIPATLKRKIAARAARERRSISAQVEHELHRAFESELDHSTTGSFVGLFSGRRMPTARDLAEVRALLWGELGKRDG